MTLTLVTGLMTAGKTTQLINTFERAVDDGLSVLVISADGRDFVADRGGRKLPATPIERSLRALWADSLILVDEAQFLTSRQVRWMNGLATNTGTDVVLYGLSHDFRGERFPGTWEARRLATATFYLPPPPCAQCGNPGEYNARIINGKVVKDGPTKVLKDAVSYEILCWECWI